MTRFDIRRVFLAVLAAAVLASGPAAAAVLQVEPVLLEVPAPGAATKLTLTNPGTTPVNVQVRVFRWRQVDGSEVLEPTADVVASPPAMTIAPATRATARLVRTGAGAAVSEDSYRVLVDQLPVGRGAGSGVDFVMRYSIPLFFGNVAGRPDVTFAIGTNGPATILVASNAGSRRMRISDVKLAESGGRVVYEGKGLLGYALAGSVMAWRLDVPPGLPSPLHLSAESDAGPVATLVGR